MEGDKKTTLTDETYLYYEKRKTKITYPNSKSYNLLILQFKKNNNQCSIDKIWQAITINPKHKG